MGQSNKLSNRQKDVVKLLLEGKSNKQIASSLGISESTVEFHLKNIYAIAQVSSRTELILQLGKSTVAGNGKGTELGHSIVASEEGVTENRDKLNSGSWAASLRDAVSIIGKELRMESVVHSNAHNEGRSMTFFESIRVCLAKYAEFDGRATRPEFWWFALFVTLAATALTYMSESLASVFAVAMLLPLLAAGARRLHDSGRSGWWQLFILAPIAGIIMLMILWAVPSVPEDKLSA